ncbi:MAG: thiamine pyrophosphate-binding protein, partial [Micromonosporaceae bacterium]
MLVAELVGRLLATGGTRHAFGLVGSGNFHLTNALVAGGVRFVPAAHEGGAASMADAYARISGEVGLLTVHQGPGVTNTLTGLTEAAKSRTPLLLLAPEATAPRSNFFIDLPAAAVAVGARFHRVRAEHAASDTVQAWRAAATGTVVLGLPLDVQAATVESSPGGVSLPVFASGPVTEPDAAAVAALADLIASARRPVFIAGRGATRPAAPARAALAGLAEICGALLAVSAAARGLFAGDPWYIDVSGGFATPLAAELIAGSDLVVAWGSTLNMWTTRHGRIISPDAVAAQVDHDPSALGANRPIALGVCGDVSVVAAAVAAELARRGHRDTGWRNAEVGTRIASGRRWRDVSYADDGDADHIDPRTLSIALDDLLPAQRTVAVDSGNFLGYPSMFLEVPDHAGFCFTQAYQSVGLGLASASGAALARPDRLTVAALGDGGFLMSVAELTTAVRLGLGLL